MHRILRANSNQRAYSYILIYTCEYPLSKEYNIPQAPLVSVIISMNDHRGLWQKAVTSWTMEQSANNQLYEVIIILDDTCRHLENKIRPLLRGHDTLTVEKGIDEMSQYDRGARIAKGDFIFFTEPHCYAMTDTVAEIIAYFKEHGDDGFCANSSPVCENRIAQMEFLSFSEGWKTWSQEGNWCKVIIRGFGIRRKAYLSSGGFRTRYSRFAEWLYAADLHSAGYRIGYAPRVTIRHAYCTSFSRFNLFIREFTEGECLYTLESEPEFFQKYFGTPAEWELFRKKDADLMKLLKDLLIAELFSMRSISRSVRYWTMVFRAALSFLYQSISGPRLKLLFSTMGIHRAKLRSYFWFFSNARMYNAFQDYWRLSTSSARIRFFLKHPFRQESFVTGERYRYDIARMNADNLYGYHGLEKSNETYFRWTSPASAIKLNIKPGSYSAGVKILDIRPLQLERDIAIFWDKEPVKEITHDREKSILYFPVTEKMANSARIHWLVILSRALRPGGKQGKIEKRQLGVPVTGVELKNSPVIIEEK